MKFATYRGYIVGAHRRRARTFWLSFTLFAIRAATGIVDWRRLLLGPGKNRRLPRYVPLSANTGLRVARAFVCVPTYLGRYPASPGRLVGRAITTCKTFKAT